MAFGRAEDSLLLLPCEIGDARLWRTAAARLNGNCGRHETVGEQRGGQHGDFAVAGSSRQRRRTLCDDAIIADCSRRRRRRMNERRSLLRAEHRRWRDRKRRLAAEDARRQRNACGSLRCASLRCAYSHQRQRSRVAAECKRRHVVSGVAGCERHLRVIGGLFEANRSAVGDVACKRRRLAVERRFVRNDKTAGRRAL